MLAERNSFTPTAIAKRLGVGVHKVHYWIRRGELAAINVARDPGKRPQWSIPVDALADFLRRRTAQPKPQTKRRPRRRDADVIEFF